MRRKKEVNLSDELFYRNFFISRSGENYREVEIDAADNAAIIEYRLNRHGYRSSEFDGSQKLLVLGCSQTHGHGMFDELTWPSLLADKLEMGFARLAKGGESIQSQVIKALQYCEKFGNPEIIVGTFPLYRMELPSVPQKFSRKRNVDDSEKNNVTFIDQVFPGDIDFDTYSKAPHDPDSILPEEIAIFYGFIFIKLLQDYCEKNNIMLLWNTWEDENKMIFNYLLKNKEKLGFLLKNYHINNPSPEIDVDGLFNVNSIYEKDCHKEWSDHILFERAADRFKNGSSHWGLHKHLHIAEFFHDEIRRKQDANKN